MLGGTANRGRVTDEYAVVGVKNEAPLRAYSSLCTYIEVIMRTIDEQNIEEVLVHARKIQDFLWNRDVRFGKSTLPELVSVLQKRITKMNGIDTKNQAWRVELRKRLLQLSALCVYYMSIADMGGIGDE